MAAFDTFGALAYRGARAVLYVAVRAYFRRVEVRDLERLPARGPVLICANHPAAITDVLVLATRLPRRIHFLAMAPIFKPWPRGFAMRLAGALPVYRREDDPDQTFRNDETFRACHEILDQGDVVLIFPEGTSETDRRLARMKTGAARLALAQEARPGQMGRLTVLPVGLHFEDRTLPHSHVILSLGAPIDLAPHRSAAESDPRGSVRGLTETLQSSLEGLFLHIPEPEVTTLVHDLERMYVDEMRAGGDTRHRLDLARRVSECVNHFRRTDPERMFRVWRQMREYQRKLGALSVEDPALREFTRSRRVLLAVRRLAFGSVGLLPALVGATINFLPYRATGWISRRVAASPERIGAARIALGLVTFPAAYAATAWLMYVAGWKPVWIAVALVASAALGPFAVLYSGWLRRQHGRLKLLTLALSRRRLLARVRHERRELIRTFDQARTDFVAAEAAGAQEGTRITASTIAREGPSVGP